jgi:deoxyuridine 5'-triphosphate nucleotidohydrolase
MVKTLKEINDLLHLSNNKVTYHWSRAPGQFLNKQSGQELKSDLFSREASMFEWYETINRVTEDLNDEMERMALQSLAYGDKSCDAYISPDVLTMLEQTVSWRPNLNFSHNHEPFNYSLAGTVKGRKFYVSAFHYVNLVVFVPDDPKSVLGILKVHGMDIFATSPKVVQKTATHNPNDAIHLEEKEPVAQTTYKTDDQAWFNPNIPGPNKALRIKFKKMSETAKIPAAIRDGDIGFDLYCDEDWSIAPGFTVKVKTNIQLADMPIMDNERNRIFMKIEGRSGLSAKGIFPTGGIIDPTYRGEISVVMNMLRVGDVGATVLWAQGPTVFNKGDRIAQLVFYKVATAGEVTMEETDHVTATNRGSAGFGSSGL